MEKKSKKFEMLSFLVLIVLILALGFTLYLRRNSITNVNKVLSNKFDEITCVDDSCEYISVYKKSKNKIYIYDSYGARISKYDGSNSKTLYTVTPAYMLFKNINKDGDIKEYYVTKSDGKKVYSSKNELVKLTDYLIEEKEGDTSKIINNKGKELYSSVTRLKRYENVSQIKVLDDEYLIDEKGNKTLSDYVIEKEVRNTNDETLYIILKDSSNAYYYFDIKTGKIKGDSFTKYSEFDSSYNTVIYKKANGETLKYTLKANGEQIADENESQGKLVNKIKENLDEKYFLYVESVLTNSQEKVLVDNKEENSFGTFNIKNKKYTKIYDYTEANGSSVVFNFDSYDGNKYYQISCSERYCGQAKVTVYDVNAGKVLYEYSANENKIKDYTGLEGGYKLIKYRPDSSEDYAGKYVLYDKNNNLIVSSKSLITVVDKKVLFGKTYDEETTVIYSAKLNKVLNTEDSLADVKKVGTSKVYTYEDDKNIYIVSEAGDELFKVNKEKSNLEFNENVILNITDKKVDLVDAKNNKVGSYKFEKNEKLITSDGSITTYKNSVFVNNEAENYGKIVDYSGNKLKKLKKTNIKDIRYSKKSNNVIIITSNGNKTKNQKVGLYIAK